ncbi:EAL domain-containing protein [Paenibacillus sp. NPDC056579]|uniref:EAL domain-containing protein n=1 Tax=unclassified Paenibacillus TaxID=185978 RepID=UPI001EF7A0A9|nr:EAL domain-containing protein [Paenibacillus sp. H1-7]ULL18728.1 EAL domain-containing protein [Paenibacillus sp. H1-7]
MANSKPQYILDSHNKSREYCLDPDTIPIFEENLSHKDLLRKFSEYEDVLKVVRFFVKKLLDSLKGNPILIVVSDENGVVLDMEGDETIKQTVNQLGIRVGVRFTEETCGTNVINLALSQCVPIELIGDDHYHSCLFSSACYSVPFHYTDKNNLLGSISIMTSVGLADPFYLTLLTMAVDSIERELLLVKQNQKLNVLNQIMINSTRSGIIMTDKEGFIIEFNDVAEQLTGLKKGLIRHQAVRQFKPMGQYISDVIEKGSKYENIQLMFERQNGKSKFVCLFDALPIYDEHYDIIGAFGQFRDVTQLYEAEEKYNHLAYHDDLTGLPNRRLFYKQINEMFEGAEQNQNSFAILYIDLDRFKMVNDTLGHRNGDILLQEVAERLKNCLETDCMLARMGGDEFTIIVPDASGPEVAVSIADAIIQKFKRSFTIQGHDFHITASIGISLYPSDGQDAETLMIHADTALYKAKETGKNNYMLYVPSMNQSSHEKLALDSSLRRAVEREEWVLHYQPQIDIRTGEVVGVEALIRWLHPEFKMVSPAEFIPLAEETGLIVPIGEWALKQACMQNKKWQDAGYPQVRVAVNLSTAQFMKKNLDQTVAHVLAETGLDPKYLELEITETMTMDVERSSQILDELSRLGVQISIDDFGTGYSSLNYLKKFSIHRLKIDRSFVRDITSDESDARIVGVIISMAHHLGLNVIAEGVETAEQVAFLKEQQCDEIQGYYFSKPLTAEELEEKYFKNRTIMGWR